MKKKIINIILIILKILFISAILVLIVTAQIAHGQRLNRKNLKMDSTYLKNIIINRDSTGNVYITESDILNDVKQGGIFDKKENSLVKKVSLLESMLNNNSIVKNADVYMDLSGEIFMQLTEYQPIARIENKNNQVFYLTKDFTKMERKIGYTAYLILANGNISEQFDGKKQIGTDSLSLQMMKNLNSLIVKIQQDDFLCNHIEAIYFLPNGNMELYTKVLGQKVIFGGFENIDDKLLKMKLLYTKGINSRGWKNFESVDVRYKNQIVCK
ncbi:hypothetical protein FACS1894180_2260 [Bacteroidia bacterium]|nr:hypothetical protein FACS1894180_2260 [Bacteroidia bacterium]